MATAKYLRFSVDDGNTSDSESVSNQRDLLDWFISSNEDLQSGEILEFVEACDIIEPIQKTVFYQRFQRIGSFIYITNRG